METLIEYIQSNEPRIPKVNFVNIRNLISKYILNLKKVYIKLTELLHLTNIKLVVSEHFNYPSL